MKPWQGAVDVATCLFPDLVSGSPFSCVVDKIDNSYITAFGTGLVGGQSGADESFTVVAKAGTASKL